MSVPNARGMPFTVRFGDDKEVGFREVTGLEASKPASRIKMPGIHKASDVTLKRGVIAADAAFWDWQKQSGKPTRSLSSNWKNVARPPRRGR